MSILILILIRNLVEDVAFTVRLQRHSLQTYGVTTEK